MNVVIFGATGMVGQGVLRECLLDSDIRRVLTVGRAPTGQQHPKLHDLVHADLFDITPLENDLTGIDACFFTLGVTSAGMSEADYTRITYDLTMAVATKLVQWNPRMTFVFVSGMGTDSTESGRTMWARVKGKAENALLRLPFARAYMFRPGFIQPMHGIRSRTTSYRVFYTLLAPIVPIMRRLLPSYVTTTERLARAMITVAKHGAPETILETAAINRL